MMKNGKADQTEREMTETEIQQAKIDLAARNPKAPKGPDGLVLLKPTTTRDYSPFSLTNPRHFWTRKRSKARNFSKAFGGYVSSEEVLVIK